MQYEHSEAVRLRVSRMVVVMVLLFTICWGPIQVLLLLQSLHPAAPLRSYTLYKLKIWAHCMSYASSALNPLLYAFMGANFRRAFRDAFPAAFKRTRRRTQPLTDPTHAELNFLSSGPWDSLSLSARFIYVCCWIFVCDCVMMWHSLPDTVQRTNASAEANSCRVTFFLFLWCHMSCLLAHVGWVC